jgi:hypothetical protein
MAKSKLKKVTAEELAEVKEIQNQINSLLMNIGNAELVKATLVESHASSQAKWKSMTEVLEKKYGSVNISLEDGSISPVEEKEKEA